MKSLLILALTSIIAFNFYINLVEAPYYSEVNILSVLLILAVKRIFDKYSDVR